MNTFCRYNRQLYSKVYVCLGKIQASEIPPVLHLNVIEMNQNLLRSYTPHLRLVLCIRSPFVGRLHSKDGQTSFFHSVLLR